MTIRNRIIDFRHVPAGELRPHPRNWRLHPPAQQEALRTVLERIGYAQALLAHEAADGTLELIDGHLRAEITPDERVPVLVLDVDEQEALELLATINPLASLAEIDSAAWDSLTQDLSSELPELDTWFLVDKPSEQPPPRKNSRRTRPVPTTSDNQAVYQVIVQCDTESEQRELFERLRLEGHPCRLSIL